MLKSAKLILPLGLGLLVGAPSLADTPAPDKKGWYLTIGAGESTTDDLSWDNTANEPYKGHRNFQAGSSYDLGMGYDFGKYWRAEFTYTKNNGEQTKLTNHLRDYEVWNTKRIKTESFMLTGYRDFPINNSKFAPYLGLGFGLTETHIDDSNYASNTDILYGNDGYARLAYQAKLGLTYDLSSKYDLFAEAAYRASVNEEQFDFEYTGVRFDGGTNPSSIDFRIGARYRF